MRIGMIGLGAMGQSIAGHILDHGYALALYDIRPEAMAPLTVRGARATGSVQELGGASDMVLLMVNNFAQCKSCVEALITTMRQGVIAIGSTIAAADARRLGDMAAACGVEVLDAPVSGGTAGAEQGTLTVMAGGSDEAFEACLPVFQTFGKQIVHVGKRIGDGESIKAINQLLVAIHMCAASEAFTLARKCGLDLDTVYGVIKESAGSSRIFENRGRFLIERNFDTRSTLTIQHKDTVIACETADAVGAYVPLGNTCRELFKLAAHKYCPTDDAIAVVRLFEEMSNLPAD